MKVGVLGSGTVGKTLGAGFLKHGHEVMLGSRDPNKTDIQQWVRENPGAKAGTFEQTAKFGDMVVVATLGRAAEEAVRLGGVSNFSGKTVMDTTNPIAETPPVGGILPYFTGPNESLAERVQAIIPQAHVVKAFNSVGAPLMVNPQLKQGTPTMFVCGDDPASKAQVSDVVRQFGWEPYDCGGLVAARALEPLCILWCLPGFQRNEWTHAFKMLTA